MNSNRAVCHLDEPTPDEITCNLCVSGAVDRDPVVVLEIGTMQSSSLIRLCRKHLEMLARQTTIWLEKHS